MKYFLPSLCGLIVMCSLLLFAIPYPYQQNISSIRHTRSNLHRLENNEKLNWDSEFKLLTDVIWIILRSYYRNKSHVHLDLIWQRHLYRLSQRCMCPTSNLCHLSCLFWQPFWYLTSKRSQFCIPSMKHIKRSCLAAWQNLFCLEFRW